VGLCDLKRPRGLFAIGALSGVVGTIAFVGCALRVRAATSDIVPPDDRVLTQPSSDTDTLGGLVLPVVGVARAALTDGFFERRGQRVHHALDILAPRHTPVRAAAGGTIAALNSSRAGGTSIWQYDATGQYCYFYAHLQRYAAGLHAGQTVERGALLGYVGTTGNAPESVPHLHFAVFRLERRGRWWAGVPVNPYPLLRGDPLAVEGMFAE
jgi:murein DD-endopeptidase MepM/ murein hydrolase activator NlpD